MSAPTRGFWGWVEERTGLVSALLDLGRQPLPGGARIRHVFGGVLFYLFVQQIVLGVVMSTYFSPSSTDAWASVVYFNDRVTAGWFVRGLHNYTSYAMIVIAGLYLAVVAISGGYKRPREVYWWSVLGLGLLIPAISISGTLLPWDEQSYARMAVEFGILRGVPGGETLARLIAGGSEFGNLTTLRIFVLHALVLPVLLGGVFWLHRRQVRRHGYWIRPPEQPGTQAQGSFLSQWAMDIGVMALVSAVLVFFTIRSHGIEIFAPAEVGSQFDARPAWYVRALNELLKYFDGSLQQVGTVVIPGAIVAFFVGLPWLDRATSPSITRRLPVVLASAAVFVGYLTLTGMNIARDRGDEHHAKSMDEAGKQATRARTLATKGVLPEGGPAVYENDPQVAIRRLFKEECQNCHKLEGIGGEEAPDFTDYKSREYLTQLTRNAMDKRFFGGSKHKDLEGKMDLFNEEAISVEDMKALTEYTFSLMGPVAGPFDKALADKGFKVYEDQCNTCHEVEAGKKGDGPNLFEHGSRDWLIRVIKNSSHPLLFGTMAQMPKYEGKLTEEQIAQLADFILQQRPAAKPQGS